MSRRKKFTFTAAGLIILLITGLSVGVGIMHKNQALTQHAAAVAAQKSACTLSAQSFMATVNQWRAAVGVPPLSYSAQLESGAKARMADMIAGNYYGHTNPVTKEQSYTAVMKYDTAATSESEVLDGNNSATSALADFKQSPEHYNALVNSSYLYFGAVAAYQPEGWAVYDNNGNLQSPAGAYHNNCLFLGELADKVGDNPQVQGAATTTSSTLAASNPFAYSTPKAAIPATPEFTFAPTTAPTCDEVQLSQITANRDALAKSFESTHEANIAALKANYPYGYANSTDYEAAILAENQRASQQNIDLQSSYAAAVKQINC